MPEDEVMIRAILSETIGRKEVDWVVKILLHDAGLFESVFRMIFEPDEKIAWHAAWVIEKISEKNTSFFSDEKNRQLTGLVLFNKHQGLQRLLLSILFNLPVHQPVSVEFINLCFEQMVSTRRSVGVQVLSMKVLSKICMVEKDFVPEMIASLENAEDSMYSAGYVATKRYLLKSLNIKRA